MGERGNLCPDPVRERRRDREVRGREKKTPKIYVNFSFTVRGVNRVC